MEEEGGNEERERKRGREGKEKGKKRGKRERKRRGETGRETKGEELEKSELEEEVITKGDGRLPILAELVDAWVLSAHA